MKLFLDANVVFSAANETSHLHGFILQLVESHTVITSEFAQQEAYRNIRCKRPQWDPGYRKLISHPDKFEDVTDIYLADLARKHGLKLATLDKGIDHPAVIRIE